MTPQKKIEEFKKLTDIRVLQEWAEDTLMEMHKWTMQYAAHKAFKLLNETLINCEHENGVVYVTDSVATSKEEFLRNFKKAMKEL